MAELRAAAFKCQVAVWEENGTLGFQKQFSSESAIAFRCKLGLPCSSVLALLFSKATWLHLASTGRVMGT